MLKRTEVSGDGTIKLVFEKGHHCVLIPQKKGYTLCISSQVGCVMDCEFCLTAKMDFKANLTVEEILEQYTTALEALTSSHSFTSEPQPNITSLVYMGMGEPFANYTNVVESINELNKKYSIPFRKITISTSGILPKMKKYIDTGLKSHLALSFHSPFQKVRDLLMPSLYRYSISDLVDVCNEYTRSRKDPIMIEYIMIKGLTDRDEDLDELCKLGFDRGTNFNLIPLNGGMELKGVNYGPSAQETCEKFKERLRNEGYKCFIRFNMGEDIEAACGMLNK